MSDQPLKKARAILNQMFVLSKEAEDQAKQVKNAYEEMTNQQQLPEEQQRGPRKMRFHDRRIIEGAAKMTDTEFRYVPNFIDNTLFKSHQEMSHLNWFA